MRDDTKGLRLTGNRARDRPRDRSWLDLCIAAVHWGRAAYVAVGTSERDAFKALLAPDNAHGGTARLQRAAVESNFKGGRPRQQWGAVVRVVAVDRHVAQHGWA